MNAIRSEPIATERLVLVPLRVQHADEMAAVLSDAELHTFTGGSPATPEELRARYERLTGGSPDPAVSWHNWVVRLGGEDRLVGTTQATISLFTRPLAAEVAWVVGTRWQRRGIATEAARGVIAWLRQQEIRTMTAHIHPDHRASAAVAAAVGLEPTDERHHGERTWRLETG